MSGICLLCSNPGAPWCEDCYRTVPHKARTKITTLENKFNRAVWFLQDIVVLGGVGSETAAHALAQLKAPRRRSGD